MNQSLEAHNDFIVLPYKSGIKMLRPKKNKSQDHSHSDSLLTISDVLNLPCNVYLLNQESKVVNGNLANARIIYCDSVKESIGKSVFDAWSRPIAARFIANDRLVENTEKGIFFEEAAYQEKETSLINFFSIKLPWYNENNNVLGVLGISVVLESQSLAQSLSAISNIGLLHAFYFQLNSLNQLCSIDLIDHQIHLTPREAEILRLMIKGQRSPEISLSTGLSKRTVEHYIENIKSKFSATSKTELIEKALHFIKAYHLNI